MGDFCHFAPSAPNFLRAKIYPNKVFFNSEKKVHRNSVQKLAPQENWPLVRIRVWFRARDRIRVWEQVSSGAMTLEPIEI